jgi:hypothetical protein
MKKFQVTMVNPQQIVEKGLKGCKTPRQVTAFAQNHNVPWTWYKPTPNYRVMLVDWPGFRMAWRESATSVANSPTPRTAAKAQGWAAKATIRPAMKSRTGSSERITPTRQATAKTTFKTVNRKPTARVAINSTGKASYRTNTQVRRTKRAA